ncbi:hypothetical protein [Methylobacillus flagellatus]|uniref:hypothetical protein n=1 Tax=Methylobacillus flagellatus TaxID=405 RepID=UPI00031860DC|nr:hypothetical protein [Methylobacillus flagellatus]
MNAYILVEIGKQKQQIASDRAFALKNGFTTQNITDWKSGKSLPTWQNMEKLASAANLELWEAVKIMKENEAKLKEAGFARMEMMAVLGTVSGLTLLGASALPSQALFGALALSQLCILC